MIRAAASAASLGTLEACTSSTPSSAIYFCTATEDCLDDICTPSDIEFKVRLPNDELSAEVSFIDRSFHFVKEREGHFHQEIDFQFTPLVMMSFAQPDYSNPSLSVSVLIDTDRTTNASVRLDVDDVNRRISGSCTTSEVLS